MRKPATGSPLHGAGSGRRAATGTIGSLFHLSINMLLHWPSLLRIYMEGPLLVLTAALLTMVATLTSLAVVRHFAPEAGGSDVQEVEGAMDRLREIHGSKVLPVKFVGGIMSISAGLVLGREGPIIHIGASVASIVTGRFRLDATRRNGLLAAGAGRDSLAPSTRRLPACCS